MSGSNFTSVIFVMKISNSWTCWSNSNYRDKLQTAVVTRKSICQ